MSILLVLIGSWFNLTTAQAATTSSVQVEKLTYVTPTRALAAKDAPQFHDDLQFADMNEAINLQLGRFAAKDLNGTIRLGQKTYPLSRAVDSLHAFQQLISTYQSCATQNDKQSCLTQFNSEVHSRFDVYAPDVRRGDPRFGDSKTALFTGYHTQPIHGSHVESTLYSHAIYRNPGAKSLYRSREDIDFKGAYKGKGLELFYADNLFDLYLMHVEGGGQITVDENGKSVPYYLSFDGTNEQRWNFLSKYMIKKGYISNPSIATQRKFLRLHPELRQEIYASCPSYVYMKLSSTPPEGSDLVPLTGGRSIATDSHLYAFKGLLAYIEARRPEETGHYDFEEEDPKQINFIPFSRFFLDQDTGGAIKGKARADIYFGVSDYAMFAASYETEVGNIYFLMLK